MAKKKSRDGEVKVVEVAQKQRQDLPAPVLPGVTFDAWWLQTQRKYGFAYHMKEAFKKHFEARGFLSSGKFDEGFRDFGYLVT